MKTFIFAVATAFLLAAPIASSAQSTNEPLTRAQVRAQLVEIEQAGYKPGTDKNTYPTEIQAAEARVATHQEAATTNATGYGPAMNGSAESSGQSMQPMASPANVGQ